jgi:AcrR family transcriptional regulator
MARPADPNAKIDLLRAAEAVFAERGLDHAKVEEITERAGHSKGSFYLHFSSKEEAFRQIVESTLARLTACIDSGELESDTRLRPADHAAKWRAHDLEMFEFIWANRRVMRLMLEGGGSASFGYLIEQFAARSRKLAAQALTLGKKSGLYRADLDIEMAAMVLAGGYDLVVRELVRADKKPDLTALLTSLQKVCLVGIAAPGLAAAVADSQVKNPGGAVERRARPARRRAAR